MELVIVVLILGIVSAIALPRMITSTTSAKTNSAKSSLSIVRTAIESYKVDIGGYPPNGATLSAALKPYLRGPFPLAPMGANAGSAAVAEGVDPPAVVAGGAGWAYTNATGDFYLNDAAGLTW